MNKTRQNQMTFRCTDDEYARVKNKIKESGCKQQEYLLAAALNQKVVSINEIAEIMHEIKKQGVNLNQIAHRLNSGEAVSDQEILREIEEVKEVWQSLRSHLRTQL